MTGENYGARIEALTTYAKFLREYLALRSVLWRATPMGGNRELAEQAASRAQAARSALNRLTPRVGRYLQDVGYTPVIRQYPPRAIGGPVLDINLMENLFLDQGPHAVDPDPLFDFIERAIGAYEELVESGETLAERAVGLGFNLISLLETKLRLMLDSVPEREKEVQDKVETLLKVSDIPYERESRSFSYSSKNYLPDFALHGGKTVLEVKFCSKKEREKELIAEINDDILAYSTAFSHSLFVVYDIGIIRDVSRFKTDLEASSKSVVLVVKH